MSMHEWALAESVVETVRQELAKRRTASVESVTVLFGELQSIDRDLFIEGIGQFLSSEMPVTLDEFTIETEEAVFTCNKCGHEWNLRDMKELDEDELEAIHFLPESAHVYIACPACGSRDFRITRGRGVAIKEIKIIEE